jgi:predicted DNA-binding transcriptional regulator YafY
MDQPKLDRLLRLMMLLTSNVTYTLPQLAEKMDTTTRSIYRYLDTFRESGFLIKKKGDFHRIDKSSPYFKDISQLIHFTEEEAYILKSAIESIDENNLIKQNLKKKLYTVYDYKILADTVARGKNAHNVNRLVEAIENKKQVIFRNYSSANSHEVRDRHVEPFRFTTNYIQIWAYDRAALKNKLFKISRIANVEILPDSWDFETDHQTGFIDIFRISSEKHTEIEVELSLRAVNLLIEEYPLAEKELERITDNKWVLRTKVASFEGVGRFVMGMINEVKIISPPSFNKFVVKRLNEGLKIFS